MRWVSRNRSSKPAALLTALALAVVSLACVVSCFAVAAPMPPCHQHHHAPSCSPLMLSAESPSAILAHAVPATMAMPLPEPAEELAFEISVVHEIPASLSPPVTLRI